MRRAAEIIVEEHVRQIRAAIEAVETELRSDVCELKSAVPVQKSEIKLLEKRMSQIDNRVDKVETFVRIMTDLIHSVLAASSKTPGLEIKQGQE